MFSNKREYERMLLSVWLYRFTDPGKNLSTYFSLPSKEKTIFEESLSKKKFQISLLAYCLMPSHFHFILRQEDDNGISKFIANITNSYTKYFNLKRKRIGPLFQGTFKAVLVETDEQLLHLTRYVHLNPVSSFLIQAKELETYPWSSLAEYLSPKKIALCNQTAIQSLIPLKKYRKFVYDYVDYAQKLEKIEHLTFDEKVI